MRSQHRGRIAVWASVIAAGGVLASMGAGAEVSPGMGWDDPDARVVGEGTKAPLMAGPGEAVYRAQCMSCHQESGEGISGVFAPLVGSPVVEGPVSGLVEVVLAGQGEMPGFSALLSDEEIAAVASYVRREWGRGTDPSVAVATVASVRVEVRDAVEAEIAAGHPDGFAASEDGFPFEDGWREDARTLVAHNCVVCHQGEGEGVSGAYPALAGNPVVVGPVGPLIRVVRDGRAGMPRFGFLSDQELAMVLSYIRTAWGNSAPAIAPGALQALR